MKLCTFKIYPEKTLYYQVNVWVTKRAMHDHCRQKNFSITRDTIGLCSSFNVYKPPSYKIFPIMGEINLFRKRTNVEVVAHEIAHAVCGWVRRIGLECTFNNPKSDFLVCADEERACRGFGKMMSQCCWQLLRHGIWKKAE